MMNNTDSYSLIEVKVVLENLVVKNSKCAEENHF